jgi:hypothetical protein
LQAARGRRRALAPFAVNRAAVRIRKTDASVARFARGAAAQSAATRYAPHRIANGYGSES